ncbi:hypothetical protein AQS8620_02169 [Aquimixticola soesokkakensis]|uniref:Zinc-ribbon domain-containing protein n=1 Tax=Aquimixticola soesokkakensis TaxID=1519096 RepID=A0A1Y5SZC9_9RHOB|nr:putative zinc-binding peptidase [Aquimixticola soesokkakensis]SLN50376.1 hypothetical protein AQS8620_02169 [Aquimixticola soesokkakensis]
MKLFSCQICGQTLYFENGSCLSCGHTVGFLPVEGRMVAVDPSGGGWTVAGTPTEDNAAPQQYKFCKNWELSACNWLVEDKGDGGEYCHACRHNHIVPDLSKKENVKRWQAIERAKRRLIYTLMELDLPVPISGDLPLVFDFLADAPSGKQAMTGHAKGLITIALTEADDAQREERRQRMGEAYRTLLGHFRHEVGHYYWDFLLADGPMLERYRTLFGDERVDYGDALERHYKNGAPENWAASFVSAYATMHPWEDWAETWAHYLHMIDSLETALGHGVPLAAPIFVGPLTQTPAENLFAAWIPLTVTLNAMSRSMGESDLYPFVLTAPVQEKLAFVHEVVSTQGRGFAA